MNLNCQFKKTRVINQLRKAYPDLTWTYNHQTGVWENSAGWHVRAVSQFSPLWDGDDDTFETRYLASNTGEIVWGVYGH